MSCHTLSVYSERCVGVFHCASIQFQRSMCVSARECSCQLVAKDVGGVLVGFGVHFLEASLQRL